MNTNILMAKRRTYLLAVLSFFATSLVQVIAQEDEEDVFDLSPFTITSEEDQGYAAVNTLAGTRLKSSLKDLAGPIQVVTEEFLEDTAVTSTEDLFLYTMSTEASGPDGNYGGGGAERRDPNVTRVRGLANPDRTRGYFLTDIGFDTYNTDRVAIAKGPNAILFGLGSPAGIVNNNLKQARFESTNEIKLQYGSWGAHREIIDINRVLIEDLVAFRLIGLNNETKYKQKPSYADERRLYGNILFTPFEKTTIRANFEIGSRDASRPNTSSPTSNIPTWLADGMPVTTGNFNQSGFGGYGGNRAPQYIYGEPDATTTNVGFDPDPATSGPDGIRRVHYTAANREETSGGQFSQGVLTDETGYIFDFRNNSLSGLDNTQETGFDAFNVSLEQQFGENAGIEIAIDEQNNDLFSRDRVQNSINVDTSSFLPYYVSDGGSGVFDPINPYVRRPYVTYIENMRRTETHREAWRVTAYYDLDLRDSDMSWLGRHVFTGLLTEQSFDILRTQNNYGSMITGEAENVLEGNRNRDFTASSWDRRGQGKRYLGPSISGIPSSGHLASRVLTDGTPRLNEFRAWMYDSQAAPVRDGDNGAYREVSGTMLVDPITNGALDSQEIESIAISAQSYFWDDRIIATYGWREDDATSWRSVASQTSDNIAILETIDLGEPTDNVKDDVFTWGVVTHLPTEDFLGGWGISAHYGESENFVPSPGRITILNEPHPSPAGETTEYGFSIEAPDNRFYVRVNWYETNSQRQTDGAWSANIPNWERLFYNNVRNSLQEKEPKDPSVPASEYETWAADDPRLWPNNILWADSYVLPPLGMREAFWNPVNPDPSPGGTPQVSDSPNANVVGVSDFASEGLEIEGVWNPTDNWTIAFNAAQMEVVKTNVLQSYREYFDLREPDWVAMGHLIARPNTYKNFDDLNGDGIAQPDEPSTAQTILQRTRTVQWPRLLERISQEGRGSDEIREWRYNLITNYRFDEDSALKGWSIGGAYRWEDDVAIGYEDGTFVDDSIVGISEVAVPDVTKPLFGPTEQNLDLWIAHNRKLFDDKVDWRIQLNIRNVLDDDDLIFTEVDGDGTPTRVRIVNPMNFRLTSTFSF